MSDEQQQDTTIDVSVPKDDDEFSISRENAIKLLDKMIDSGAMGILAAEAIRQEKIKSILPFAIAAGAVTVGYATYGLCHALFDK